MDTSLPLDGDGWVLMHELRISCQPFMQGNIQKYLEVSGGGLSLVNSARS